MNVIITGSRDWNNTQLIYNKLDALLEEFHSLTIIHGRAKGADFIAGVWAKKHGVPVVEFPAEWKRFGKAAGMIRNREMLEAYPDALVVAFPLPQSIGTYGMLKEAEERGHGIWVYKGNY